jgi:rhodanese-related sulfurtransferase
MSVTTLAYHNVSPQAAHQRLADDPTARLIDVRTPIEFREVHAEGAHNIPLDELKPADLSGSSKSGEIFVLCKSGGRAAKACEALLAAGLINVFRIEGGTDAWERAGLPVVRTEGVVSLERQVRIAAGSLVLLGVILGTEISPWFYALAGFVGAGLVFAGITRFCGMGLLLAKAPWNRAKGMKS